MYLNDKKWLCLNGTVKAIPFGYVLVLRIVKEITVFYGPNLSFLHEL